LDWFYIVSMPQNGVHRWIQQHKVATNTYLSRLNAAKRRSSVDT